MSRVNKYVFFKAEATARRFKKLYGYRDNEVIHIKNGWYEEFILEYFGPAVNNMYLVEVRVEKKEVEEWKLADIKEKKLNGHRCYIYEG